MSIVRCRNLMYETSGVSELVDKLAVADLVQFERLYRDQQKWEQLRAAYHPDSLIRLGWFVGNVDAYIESSRRLEARTKGWRLTHLTAPTQVQVCKDRAIAETTTLIIRRAELDGVLVDTTIYCRLHSRVERRDGSWRLLTLDGVYEKDTVIPVYPSDRLELDRKALEQEPVAYRFTAYNLRKLGYSVRPDELYMTNQPERVSQLYSEAEDWLYSS